jgi:hypothetical protein
VILAPTRLRITALHEAAHAVVGLALGGVVETVSVRPTALPDGRRRNGHCRVRFAVEPGPGLTRSALREAVWRRLVVTAAGPCGPRAWQGVLPVRTLLDTGAGGDRRRLADLDGRYGTGFLSGPDGPANLANLMGLAFDLTDLNRTAVAMLAKAVEAAGELDRAAVERMDLPILTAAADAVIPPGVRPGRRGRGVGGRRE